MLVSYDVSTITKEGRSRLRRAAKICQSYGVRVQYSVFECSVTTKEEVTLRRRLLDTIVPSQDSLRIYYLSEDDARKTEHFGVRQPLDLNGPLIA